MWPTPQDYNEAIQNPALSFDDAELRRSLPETSHLGIPRPVSGSFASVYHMEGGGGEWAVRCFLHHFADQEQRYCHISQFLAEVALQYTVDFEFLARGIRVRGEWFPVLKMDWVSGLPLTSAIETALNSQPELAALDESFVEMSRTLELAGIAHGDFQHGNILVCDGKLKLVDYDGMFVPALAGLPSNEIGHRNYQHPTRTAGYFDARLDRFAAWSIHTSLFCLQRDPSLWHKLGGGDERLLFKHADYVRPLSSETFYLLENHESSEIRYAAQCFRAIVSAPLDQIPPLGHEPKMEGLSPVLKPGAMPSWLVPDEGGVRLDYPTAIVPTPLLTSEAPSGVTLRVSQPVVNFKTLTTAMQSTMLSNLQTNGHADPNRPSTAIAQPTTPQDWILGGLAFLLIGSVMLFGYRPHSSISKPASARSQAQIVYQQPAPPPQNPTNRLSPRNLRYSAYAGPVNKEAATYDQLDASAAWTQFSVALQAHESNNDAKAIQGFLKSYMQFAQVRGEKGMALSAYELAYCYHVTKDDNTARHWLDVADKLHIREYLDDETVFDVLRNDLIELPQRMGAKH